MPGLGDNSENNLCPCGTLMPLKGKRQLCEQPGKKEECTTCQKDHEENFKQGSGPGDMSGGCHFT